MGIRFPVRAVVDREAKTKVIPCHPLPYRWVWVVGDVFLCGGKEIFGLWGYVVGMLWGIALFEPSHERKSGFLIAPCSPTTPSLSTSLSLSPHHLSVSLTGLHNTDRLDFTSFGLTPPLHIMGILAAFLRAIVDKEGAVYNRAVRQNEIPSSTSVSVFVFLFGGEGEFWVGFGS